MKKLSLALLTAVFVCSLSAHAEDDFVDEAVPTGTFSFSARIAQQHCYSAGELMMTLSDLVSFYHSIGRIPSECRAAGYTDFGKLVKIHPATCVTENGRTTSSVTAEYECLK